MKTFLEWESQATNPVNNMGLSKDSNYQEIQREVVRWVKEATRYLASGEDDRVETEMYGFQLRIRSIAKSMGRQDQSPWAGNKIISHNPPKIQLEYKFKWDNSYQPIKVEELVEWMYKTRGSK